MICLHSPKYFIVKLLVAARGLCDRLLKKTLKPIDYDPGIILRKFEIDMVAIDKQAITNIWVAADWDEYIKNIEHPAYKKAKGYYHNNKYRIKAAPIDNEHSQDHFLIGNAVLLYAMLKGIPLTGKDNCSYCQAGLREF